MANPNHTHHDVMIIRWMDLQVVGAGAWLVPNIRGMSGWTNASNADLNDATFSAWYDDPSIGGRASPRS